MAVITIVGAGMMGSALAFPAAENGHEVRLTGTPLDREIIGTCRRTGRHPKFEKDFPEGVTYYQTEETDEALRGADLVIGGVSSFGVDWFGEEILPRIAEGTPVLTVTKGLIDCPDGTLLPYPVFWQRKLDALGKQLPLCAVGGPCTSYELVAHDQTEVTYCGRDREVLRRVREWMRTDYYHISLSTDVTGIESAVALKNGYALGIALTIGLNRRAFGPESPLHYNSQAAVFGQASREMASLMKMQGAEDPYSLWVGLGDLYVTVYGGRTRLVGILLGEGKTPAEAKEELKGVTLESLVVAERVARAVRVRASRGPADLRDYPLLMHVDDLLAGRKDAAIPWESFTYEHF